MDKKAITFAEKMRQAGSRLKNSPILDLTISEDAISFYAMATGYPGYPKKGSGSTKMNQQLLPIKVGNTKNMKVPADDMGDGFVMVPILKKHPAGKKEGQREYFKMDNDKYKLESGASVFISVSKIVGTVKPMGIILVSDFKVKEVIVDIEKSEQKGPGPATITSVKEKRIYLSARLIQACQGLPTIDFINKLEDAGLANSVFRRYEKTDGYSSDVINFICYDGEKMRELAMESDVNLLPKNKEGFRHIHNIAFDGEFTFTKDTDKKPIRVLKMDSIPTCQYYPNQTESYDQIVIRVSYWNDRLDTFCIKDPNAWKELGPLIVQQSKMIGGMNLNKQKTSENATNAEGAPKSDADYVLVYYGTGLLFDAAYTYDRIGLSVTLDFVKKYLPKYRRYDRDMVADDLKDASVICLNETAYDIDILVRPLEGEYKIKAIFRSRLDFNEIAVLKTVDAQLGSEILESAIMQQRKNEQKWRAKIDKESQLYEIDLKLESADSLIYFFLIINRQASKAPELDYISAFIDGFPQRGQSSSKIQEIKPQIADMAIIQHQQELEQEMSDSEEPIFNIVSTTTTESEIHADPEDQEENILTKKNPATNEGEKKRKRPESDFAPASASVQKKRKK